MGVRKSATRLSTTERDNFLRAVLTLKNTIANPGDPAANQISIFDRFVALHLGAINITFGATTGLNMGHQDSAFCPWHRYYLYQFEQALQTVDATVTLPYWDWTDHFGTENILFKDDFLGPNGTGPIHTDGGRSVQSGYFAFNRPGTGGNPTPLPGWWPGGLAGWRVRPTLAQGHSDPADPATGKTLQRALGLFTNLSTLSQINACFTHTDYEGGTATTRFRNQLEHGARTHDFHHGWVGGNMGDPASSPNDLIFFLHHCNIDRLWAMWQLDGHAGPAFYPAAGRPLGHNLGDAMWPWVGAAAGYSAPNLASDIVLADFTASPVIHPSDALNHRALAYCYDTEAVVGIALDQTGSMLQITPDPMVVAAPDVSKWEAAKRGVAALLHDCETAYAQKEAFVIAGVETFRTLGANVFTPVFAGVPYGVVKAGGAYSEAAFNSAVTTMSPGGGTPLAGALLDTETTLVRAPLSNLPAHDTRFLLFFTDGLETASPLLTTVSAGALTDTIVFAMGFGNPGDVDYTTIANIVAKGKAAPPLVTSQVYHGENAGEINKFFTNSIAHALGYTPVIDPIYEVFPGEHVDTPYWATDADQSFMITVQGFDFNDANWQCCLILPDGDSCSCDGDCDEALGAGGGHDHGDSHGGGAGHTHEHSGVLVTSNKKNGRITVFVNRNGAESDDWVGRWKVRVMYRMTMDNERMFMATDMERLFPVGARPVRGPVFAQAALPVRSRKSARILPASQARGRAVVPVTGANASRDDASTVAVNVYARSTLRIGLRLDRESLVAGRDLAVRLEATDIGGARVSGLTAFGRLVAPGFSVGNLLLDTKAVPIAKRTRLTQTLGSERVVDTAALLAAIESKKPGSFAMRDELVALTRKTKRGPIEAAIKADVPGVYRLAVQVSGELNRGADGEPEPFTRILNFEIPVGLDVDVAKIDPKWQIANGELSVRYQLADRHGNHLSPAQDHRPSLLLNGRPLATRVVNDLSGTYRLEAKLLKIALTARGTIATGGGVALADGGRLELRQGSPFKVELKIGELKMPVRRHKV